MFIVVVVVVVSRMSQRALFWNWIDLFQSKISSKSTLYLPCFLNLATLIRPSVQGSSLSRDQRKEDLLLTYTVLQ